MAGPVVPPRDEHLASRYPRIRPRVLEINPPLLPEWGGEAVLRLCAPVGGINLVGDRLIRAIERCGRGGPRRRVGDRSSCPDTAENDQAIGGWDREQAFPDRQTGERDFGRPADRSAGVAGPNRRARQLVEGVERAGPGAEIDDAVGRLRSRREGELAIAAESPENAAGRQILGLQRAGGQKEAEGALEGGRLVGREAGESRAACGVPGVVAKRTVSGVKPPVVDGGHLMVAAPFAGRVVMPDDGAG